VLTGLAKYWVVGQPEAIRFIGHAGRTMRLAISASKQIRIRKRSSFWFF
jgi:hypothetical protein